MFYTYMDLNLLIAQNETEWRGADRMMRAALSKFASRVGVRPDEHNEVIAATVIHLLWNDARVLRKADAHKVGAFIRQDLYFMARNHVRKRQASEARQQCCDSAYIERKADQNGQPWAGTRKMAYT